MCHISTNKVKIVYKLYLNSKLVESMTVTLVLGTVEENGVAIQNVSMLCPNKSSGENAQPAAAFHAAMVPPFMYNKIRLVLCSAYHSLSGLHSPCYERH